MDERGKKNIVPLGGAVYGDLTVSRIRRIDGFFSEISKGLKEQ